jgi:ABC-2 type transport system permease protein
MSEMSMSETSARETSMSELSTTGPASAGPGSDGPGSAGPGSAGQSAGRPGQGGTAWRAGELPAGRYGLRGVIQMEWIKLRSLRSTWWITAVVVVSMIGLAILVLRTYPAHWAHMSAADRASFDPTDDGYVGLGVAQLAVAILGILAATGEYSSGMIRSTLVAVPRRGLVLAAKAVVIGLVTLVLGEVLAFAAFLSGQSVLHSPAPHAALGQPGVLRAVVMAGAYLPLTALIGLGIGAMVRHAAVGISAAVTAMFVLPVVLLALPESVQHPVLRYLPVAIAENSLTAVKAVPYSLSPWAGLAVLVLYAAVALGAAGVLLARRDA